MTMPLSPIAYATLLVEDIKWLKSLSSCLEQRHILAILEEQLYKTGYSYEQCECLYPYDPGEGYELVEPYTLL